MSEERAVISLNHGTVDEPRTDEEDNPQFDEMELEPPGFIAIQENHLHQNIYQHTEHHHLQQNVLVQDNAAVQALGAACENEFGNVSQNLDTVAEELENVHHQMAENMDAVADDLNQIEVRMEEMANVRLLLFLLQVWIT